MNKLLEEFNAMDKQAMFEIESNNNEGEYGVFYINATKEGLEAGSCSNSGFGSLGIEIVEWDDCFSLDEHLQELYEICLDYMDRNNI